LHRPSVASAMNGFVAGKTHISRYKEEGPGKWEAYARENMSRQGGQGAKRGTGTKLPKLLSIHHGIVLSIHPFGAFIQLGDGNTYKEGLLPISGLTGTRIERVEEVLSDRAKVWVKCVDVRPEEGKYSLDMRYVSQRDGTDLDRLHKKGVVPDNHWGGVRSSRLSTPPCRSVGQSPATQKDTEVNASPEFKRKRSSGSDDDDSDDVSTKKADKKFKKIMKQMKKAEKKEKKKKAKKKAKKAKKKAEGKSCSSSHSSSSTS